MIHPRPHLTGLAPYALADLNPDLTSLAQNESAFPPSPLAIAAGQKALVGTALYPDPDWRDLRAALSEIYQVDPTLILCGNGSMELIWALIHAYAGPGDQVLSTAHAYALFKTATAAAGADYIAAPEADLTVSIDKVLSLVTPATKIVCIANPGNPTGTMIGNAELIRLRQRMSEDILLLVDEAYAEFSVHCVDWGFPTPAYGENTVALRTLSKAYALAGQRVGWGIFPPNIASEVRKLINPNNISLVGQAMATAAVKDQAYMQDIVAQTVAERDRFISNLQRIGLNPVPSHTNFVLIPFNDTPAAQSADQALRTQGILMRGMAGYDLPNCLRATVGPRAAMDQALDALTTWKEQEDAR